MTDTIPAIAIIGAGIAGLTAAATLRRIGLDAHIYEQAQAFARIGAGIQMNPNAMKILRGLGLEQHIRGRRVRTRGRIQSRVGYG
jgi:6-hydroxynicotinate 3-monooxygenase